MCAGFPDLQHIEGAHCRLVSDENRRALRALSAGCPGWQHILPRMLQLAEDIYEDVMRCKASREQCPLPAPAAKKAKGGLKARDPW